MSAYEEAHKAFDEHLATCETCKEAANQREACERGRELHEAMVKATHDA